MSTIKFHLDIYDVKLTEYHRSKIAPMIERLTKIAGVYFPNNKSGVKVGTEEKKEA